MTDHVHDWRLVLHLDGCHFYSSEMTCECGARASFYSERDPLGGDSWAAIWMDESCERCRELLDGATPVRDEKFVIPEGNSL